MRYLFIFIFYFTFSFAHLTDGSLDNSDIKYIQTKKTINVCINPDWAPIEFRENGVQKGISIDILKLITKKVGFKINFVYTKTWKESQSFLQKHICDITPTAIKTSKRLKYAIFTRPYLDYDLAIITTQDKPYVTNLESIVDKTITRKRGSGLISKLTSKYPHIKIIKADSFIDMFELVSKDKVYATIATLPVFAYYKKRYNLNNLKIAGFTGWKYPLRMMINKDEKQLREILDAEISLISPYVTQRIYEKWIIKTKSEFDYKQFFIFIAFTIFIILFLGYWIYLLHKKNRELERLSTVKSRFLANMSHELRTPLNAILGFLELIKKDFKECKRYLPFIEASSKTLFSEINDILNFERLNKKNIEIENETFSYKEMEYILLFYKEEASKKGVKFSYIFRTIPKYLNADIDKIRDILVHLVGNAVKFTKQGEIQVSIIYKNERLKVIVKDSGIGIPKTKLKDIFKEFYQIDSRVNKDFEGIGIGLAITKKLVDILGGKLKVTSQVGVGSEFEFEIPIKKIEKTDNSEKIDKKILVVEDNKANQMFIKVLLKQLNIDFDMAENGEIAVNLYKQYHYPIILMDINMPIMDGIQATHQIREYEKVNKLIHSKIVAVTANAIDGDKDKFLKEGMDEYIPKPVNIEKLKEILYS